MKPMPHIVSLMTPFPHFVEASQTIHDARLIMQAEGIRHLPVMSEGQLVGILTDRDLRLALGLAGTHEESVPLRVGDVCNLEAYVVEYDTPVDQVVTHMNDARIGAAVVTRNGKLVGIFTMSDVCKHYEELLRASYPDA